MKKIERQQFGMRICLNVLDDTTQKVAVACADNNDAVVDREEAENNMTIIIRMHDNLHAASGRNIQEEKLNS